MNGLLDIRNLHVAMNEATVLRGINLRLKAGEVHALMGANGSGKSTLAYALAGHPDASIRKGTMRFQNKDIRALEPEARAAMGLALAFQYPVALEGVSVMTFLKTSLAAQRKARQLKPLGAGEVLAHIRACAKYLQIDDAYLRRWVNVGFSGGEKKRLEMLQMAIFEPSLMVFDEVDSGLDVDALKIVAASMRALQAPTRAQLIITHYQRLLRYVQPTHVHVLLAGRIVESGGPELGERVEKDGYLAYSEHAPDAVA